MKPFSFVGYLQSVTSSFTASFPHTPWTQHRPDRPFAQFSGTAVHRVYPDTADSHGHAHQRPRTLFPPTVQRARTVHALPPLPLADAPHTLNCDWPSVATRRCVLWVLFFFFFSVFSSPCFTHTAERKGSQSEKKNDLNPSPVQAAALATAVSLFCTGFDNKKWYLDILSFNAIAKIYRDGLTRGKLRHFYKLLLRDIYFAVQQQSLVYCVI